MPASVTDRKRSPDRIDSDELGADDVVIRDVDVFRLERMTERHFWLKCYKADGSEITFDIHSRGVIRVTQRDE